MSRFPTGFLTGRRVVLAGVVLLLLAGCIALVKTHGKDPMRISADFGDTTGLYVGNEVDYLGVPIGTVTAIKPQGTLVRVEMELDPDIALNADSAIVILQSSLVTDRFVEIGPAYDGGETMASGAHFALDHTRSPATIDEITRAVDDLVVALSDVNKTGPGLGDLIHSAAGTLDGNGSAIHDALLQSQRALSTISDSNPDIRAVVTNLGTLVDALAERDTTIRKFAKTVSLTTAVVADQRHSIVDTLSALRSLSAIMNRFVERNQGVISDDLAQALTLIKVVDARQQELGEAWDVMPALAENLARAYDFQRKRLRVQFSFEAGPFNSLFTSQACRAYAGDMCDLFFQPDGSGLLDPLFGAPTDILPGNIP